VKLLTDLQNLGCELHKNAFGGRAPSGPARGATALPQTLYPLAVIRGKGGSEGEGKGFGIGRGRKGGREGSKGVGRVRKGEEALDLGPRSS